MTWRLPLPADPTHRRLLLAGLCSVLLHVLLLGAVFWVGELVPPVYVKRGEPLFVDIAPENPAERAPLGNPARLPGPDARGSETAAAPRPAPPRPRVAEVPRPATPRPAARAPEAPWPPPPKQVAKAEPPAPEPATQAPTPEPAPPSGSAAAPPEPPGTEPAPPGAQQPPTPQVAARTPEGMWRRPPGGGGGLRGGRGGIEGEPIPLDTTEPRYQEYFDKIRARIKAKWVYPREAGERGIEGDLNIEFHIAKDGGLAFIELRRSSGVDVLDQAALNAVKLAQPFPPVPDSLSKAGLPINGLFVYRIRDDAASLVKRFR
jgi:protein TonB